MPPPLKTRDNDYDGEMSYATYDALKVAAICLMSIVFAIFIITLAMVLRHAVRGGSTVGRGRLGNKGVRPNPMPGDEEEKGYGHGYDEATKFGGKMVKLRGTGIGLGIVAPDESPLASPPPPLGDITLVVQPPTPPSSARGHGLEDSRRDASQAHTTPASNLSINTTSTTTTSSSRAPSELPHVNARHTLVLDDIQIQTQTPTPKPTPTPTSPSYSPTKKLNKFFSTLITSFAGSTTIAATSPTKSKSKSPVLTTTTPRIRNPSLLDSEFSDGGLSLDPFRAPTPRARGRERVKDDLLMRKLVQSMLSTAESATHAGGRSRADSTARSLGLRSHFSPEPPDLENEIGDDDGERFMGSLRRHWVERFGTGPSTSSSHHKNAQHQHQLHSITTTSSSTPPPPRPPPPAAHLRLSPIPSTPTSVRRSGESPFFAAKGGESSSPAPVKRCYGHPEISDYATVGRVGADVPCSPEDAEQQTASLRYSREGTIPISLPPSPLWAYGVAI